MPLFKKDSYIPALRVPADLAERARTACTKLSIDPPEVRRELWEDLIRVTELDQHLIRPGRILTTELVAGLSKAVTPDDVVRVLSPGLVGVRVHAILSAAAAVALLGIGVVTGQYMSSIGIHNPPYNLAMNTGAKRSAANPAPPSPPPADNPDSKNLATNTAANRPAANPTPQSSPPPDNPNSKTSTEQAADSPARLASAASPETISGAHAARRTPTPLRRTSSLAKVTKDAAADRAGYVWDKKERLIGNQIAEVDRKIGETTGEKQKHLKEWKKYFQQKKQWVSRSRSYHQNEARLAWDEAHGAPKIADAVRASLGM
jgi:hypothetical protein